MASALQEAVEGIQMNDYTTLVVVIAIGYDYILTLSDEIDYVWNKPWTGVSTLFILARYFGICNFVIYALLGSSFLPGPPKFTRGRLKGGIVNVAANWIQMIFMIAAELAMILRVWTLYDGSRFILGTLLTVYAVEALSYLIISIQLLPSAGTATTVQILDFSFCVSQSTLSVAGLVSIGAQIALGALMCLLLLIQFLRESIRTYRATKRFCLNRYMILLVREGVVYFLVIVGYALIGFLDSTASSGMEGWLPMLLYAVQLIPPCTLVPRFILNLRKLYARDSQGRDVDNIDTGFGGVLSAIVFEDVPNDQNERLEEQDGEEIHMEER